MNKQTAKLIARIAENLPDMDEDVMQGWIENPKSLQRALKEVLCPPSERTWKTWKTIKLGTFNSVDEIRKALKAGGFTVNDRSNDILGKPAFTMSNTEQDVELVNVSVEELGFKDGTRYTDICKRALELGLDYCPAEVGPQLRLQFKDQPKGTYVVVAMKTITVSDGHPRVFRVECYGNGEPYLSTLYGYASSDWDASVRFVFVRRK